MDIGINQDTANSAGGVVGSLAAVKLIWNDFKTWRDKKDIYSRLDQQDDEIASHAVLDAQSYVTKETHSKLIDHIDKRFDKLTDLVLGVIKDGARGKK